MNRITFISTFPRDGNFRDGYYRRVDFVDQVFEDSTRLHLDIRFRTNFRKSVIKKDRNTSVIHLNAILHFFLITSILRNSSIVYIHSVAKIPSILFSLLIIKNTVPIAIDFHGIFAEELQLSGKIFKAYLYSWIERFCFSISSLNIYVTEAMKTHFRQKYPYYSGSETIFVPYDSSIDRDLIISVEDIRQLLNIKDSDIVIIYSGNCQRYQNVELMLDYIKGHDHPGYKFIFLTGQPEIMNQLISNSAVPSRMIRVLSVDPKELKSYYELAHFGLIFRDDILVNRVANPTKLAEYLQYGIVPIVKLVDIGDYARFNYDYISYLELSNDLTPGKSAKNRDIYREISQKYGSQPLQDSIRRIQNRYMTPNKA